ncbi:BREX-1 system adenine-specific DNA-methyltransferase PglX [Paenibacillus sediminis]|uniref:site-specific DNA-methyltransferase (adenine-specific) n=1 Tax=Paenibacillus sediminis TaxID=664909 RepID=A0ABS4GYG4_9BACL|nr:BREX-1 system adenine-specific DNA-methyltransferase PglX [Paenibacillus sediminis]MBP1935311.1 type II restriction/modification system DNA methylase subunit YeeA [Paenibacillus sediminis]
MNKTAIKNFAIWARKKLIAEITYKAGLIGVTGKGIKNPLPQSTKDVQFFDIGAKEPYSITGVEIEQRRNLADIIQKKEKQSDYKTAYNSVIEEVAYTWFNRLIAVRFMEVNDYLPSRIRVLSSESSSKIEPDLVTSPFDADLDYTPFEKDRIIQLKNENKLDELFRMLFIKQCNALNAILPELFEKTNDYTELLMNVSFTDKDGVVYRLVHDIPEDDFNVEKEGQVEIIGWLYQYYNTEPKDETFALLKKNVKITKERIPAATQLFTPDWIVRYMVENSLGRLWLEGHPNDQLKANWKYYLDEAEQEPEVQAQLDAVREVYKNIKPEDIKVIDPCMGSGHILVYAFDVLMQIYESYGYSQRDAAKSILENNLYGLDIDNRAYQLAYFAVMMKARQYNRRIFNGEISCHVHAIQESNEINRAQLRYFGQGMSDLERNTAVNQIEYLLDTMRDAKEYGSILNVDNLNWELLYKFTDKVDFNGQITLDSIGLDATQKQLRQLVEIAVVLAQKYDVVVTNPPYMGNNSFNSKMSDFVKVEYPDSKWDLFAVFIERCNRFTKLNCYQAMITQHSWMFLSSYETLRKKMIRFDIVNMAHLGAKAFDEIGGEIVQTTSFVIRKSDMNSYCGIYVRLVDLLGQQEKETAFLSKNNEFISAKINFSKIPGTPLSYWVSEPIANAFINGKSITEYVDTFQGIITGDNDKFLRLWTEVESTKIPFHATNMKEVNLQKTYWIPYNKGGEFRKWYGIQDYVVNWKNGPDDKTRGKKTFQDYYLREYVAWSYTVSNSIAARYYPPGFLWDVRGSGIMDKSNLLYYLQALICSKIGITLFRVNNSTLSCQVENIIQLPIIVDESQRDLVTDIVKNCVEISKNEWNSFEISWDFVQHPFLTFQSTNKISDSYAAWDKYTISQFSKLKSNEEKLNSIFIKIYGLEGDLTPEVEDKEVTLRKADLGREVRSFISYAVGCMFGRYSLDVDGLVYAGGDWNDSKYTTFTPDKDNVIPITDEQYFEDDIVGLFCAFLKKSFGSDTLEENLDFIAKALGNKGNTSREVIRNYFLKDFFKDHCKVYQKRPIYWLFDSGKEDGFKALIYMHRYNEDTIGNLRIDYLHRMQRIYESEIARMQDTIDNSNNAREIAAATKRKEKLIRQLKETKEYDEKIAHLALARISIDLDDGVKVNYDKVQTGTDGKKLDVLAKI